MISKLAAMVTTLVAIAMPGALVAQGRMTLTDIKGRTITLERPAQRLLIDDGRFLVALSLLHRDPVSLLAAWPHDVNRLGQRTYDQYRAHFPTIASIPQVGSSAETFSLEQAIAAKPDVAVISASVELTGEQVRRLEAAGIKVVFIDFFVHPFQNLEPSLTLLGRLIGREPQAKAFLAFRRSRLDAIETRLRDVAPTSKPKVFFEAHAGISAECCNAPGRGNQGDYIDFVGGHNIAVDVLKQAFGRISLEYVIAQRPDIYIGTGGPHLERTGGLVVGQGYTPAQARASLAKVVARPGISSLPAVRNGRAHGVAHQLLNSPLDIVAVEALAKWVHPSRFADLDIAGTLAEINTKFLAVPYEGTYWIDLR